MKVWINHAGRVVCDALIPVPLSARVVWGQLRDFRATASHDPFHFDIVVEGSVPRKGAALRIEHRYLGFRTIRVGRILRWNECGGFAFSDLCQSNPARSFPHVVSYRVAPVAEKSSQLRIRVGGKWTARGPKWMGRIWLWWVFGQMVRTTGNQLLMFALAEKKKLPKPV